MTRFAMSGPVEGIRLYGSTAVTDHTLRPEMLPDLHAPGVPELPVMWLGITGRGDQFMVCSPECLLIEFERNPGVAYLAWAIRKGEIPMIQFSPVELHPTDGSEIPKPGMLGEKEGIQDQGYTVRPDGTKYRFQN